MSIFPPQLADFMKRRSAAREGVVQLAGWRTEPRARSAAARRAAEIAANYAAREAERGRVMTMVEVARFVEKVTAAILSGPVHHAPRHRHRTDAYLHDIACRIARRKKGMGREGG